MFLISMFVGKEFSHKDAKPQSTGVKYLCALGPW
jgi:hypothetical protein